MKRGANAFLQGLDNGSFSVASPEAFAAACAAAARCMGGSSGALYDILFTAAAGTFVCLPCTSYAELVLRWHGEILSGAAVPLAC